MAATALVWDLSSDTRQIVLASAELPIEHVDSSGKTDTEQRADLEFVLSRHRHTPFDLYRPPLLRLAVQRLDARRHRLVWTHHHAILDGRAHQVLLAELLHRYNTGSSPASPQQFGPYARWLSEQPREQQQAHWAKHLSGYPGCAPLPPTPLDPSLDRFGQHTRTLPDAVTAELTAFSQVHGATLSAALVACWSLIAARQRERTDTAVGVTVSGRSPIYPQVMDIAGPLASTVPLLCPADPQEGVGAWINRVHDALAQADQHSGCSSADLHTWTGLAEGQNLYDSVIAVANYPYAGPLEAVAEDDDTLVVVDTAQIQAHGGRTRHALTLIVETTAG
ncbi:condensation domain-containing protein, partial [Nonomuraea sp. NPDC049784]|uniref:condensation domain-containing protein n=1 Tax=Nonomuraea sp. NPDC049784 TaxID=3154361 RepID=UPI0033E68C42